jgi:hypothetical protein
MATPILRLRCKTPFDLCQRSGDRPQTPSAPIHNYPNLAGSISRGRIDFSAESLEATDRCLDARFGQPFAVANADVRRRHARDGKSTTGQSVAVDVEIGLFENMTPGLTFA